MLSGLSISHADDIIRRSGYDSIASIDESSVFFVTHGIMSVKRPWNA